MTRQPRRRRFLTGLVVAGAGTLAGCSDLGSGDEDGEDGEGDEDAVGGDTTAAATTAAGSPVEPETTTATPARTPVANPRPEIDSWLSNTPNYDGTVLDETGEARVVVSVGAEGRNDRDGFAFDPPACRITTGTEVTWLWTDEGGDHTVVDTDDRFDSGQPESGGGTTFIHTFERPGLYRYRCTVHGDLLNMRGALVVEY